MDRHRTSLIQHISSVIPVLDDLWQPDPLTNDRLLTDEQYETVCNKSTTQDQMRELFRHVRSWNNDDKKKVYEALKRHNSSVIKKLEP